MNINATLIFSGLGIMLTGLYLEFPIKFSKAFWLMNGPIAAICVIFMILVWWFGKPVQFREGFRDAGKTTAAYMPLLFVLMFVMGFGGILATIFYDRLKDGLTGTYGYFWTFMAAWIIPGGNTMSRFVKKLWENRELRPMLLYFLTASPLISMAIYFIRSLGLDEEIAWAMYRVNFGLAVVLAPCFWIGGKIIRLF